MKWMSSFWFVYENKAFGCQTLETKLFVRSWLLYSNKTVKGAWLFHSKNCASHVRFKKNCPNCRKSEKNASAFPPERKSKIPKTHYIAIKILSPVREARWEVANLTKQKNPPVYGVKEIVRLYVCLWSNLLFIMEGWRGITVWRIVSFSLKKLYFLDFQRKG